MHVQSNEEDYPVGSGFIREEIAIGLTSECFNKFALRSSWAFVAVGNKSAAKNLTEVNKEKQCTQQRYL